VGFFRDRDPTRAISFDAGRPFGPCCRLTRGCCHLSLTNRGLAGRHRHRPGRFLAIHEPTGQPVGGPLLGKPGPLVCGSSWVVGEPMGWVQRGPEEEGLPPGPRSSDFFLKDRARSSPKNGWPELRFVLRVVSARRGPLVVGCGTRRSARRAHLNAGQLKFWLLWTEVRDSCRRAPEWVWLPEQDAVV